jgi:hypothetical protein
MLQLAIDPLSIDKLIPQLSQSVTNYHYGRRIELKESIASGYIKELRFDGKTKATLCSYTTNTSFNQQSSFTDEQLYILYFIEVTSTNQYQMALNGASLDLAPGKRQMICLLRHNDTVELSGEPGINFKTFKIMLDANSVLKAPGYSGINKSILSQYFEMGPGRLGLVPFNEKFNNLVSIIANTEDNIFYLAATEKIIDTITSYFFKKLSIKMQQLQTV